MKSTLFFALGLTALLLASAALRAEDWATTDGKSYKEVTVIKVELDAVTITHHDGGALVPLVNLPPDLQKRFNYDPVKAKTAAAARVQADAKNAIALQAEIDQAKVVRRIMLIESDPRIEHSANGFYSGGLSDSPTVPPTLVLDTQNITETGPDGSTQYKVTNLSPDTASSSSDTTEHNITDLTHDPLAPSRGPNRHSMDELVDINSKLKDDHYSPNRHTAASLLLAASHLMPDSLDPTHHSTEELINPASPMTTPPSDTGNRHSTTSLINTSDPLARP